MKLYELAAEYENLLNAIDAGEIPEEAITDTLESITSLLEEKADNIGCIIKNLTAEAEAIKTEEVRLAERRRAKENQIERLKAYLAEVLTRGGYTKLETARNKMTFRKSESTVIDNETEFIAWAMENNDALLTYKDPTINKTAIKKAIANGEDIVGAHIESKMNLQIK